MSPPEKRVYKKNYITNVVFQLRFPMLQGYLDKLKEFQSLIKKDFPVLEENKGFIIEYKTDENGKVESNTKEAIKWNLFDKTKTKIVSYDQDNITLEFTKYTNFEEFLKVVNLLVSSLFKIFPSIMSTRMGLRYINQINLSGNSIFDWSGLLNKNLMNSIDFISDKKKISRHMTMVDLNYDDYRIVFQYGFANSLYPSTLIKKEFVLDYDCATLESLDNSEKVLNKIKILHGAIIDLFEKSIEDGLRIKMNGDDV